MLWIAGMTVLVLIFVAATRLLPIIYELMVRIVLGLGLAICGGIVVGIWAGQNGHDGVTVAISSALLLGLPGIAIMGAMRSSIHSRPNVATFNYPNAASVERQVGMHDGRDLTEAWEAAIRLASRKSLDAAREASARLLVAVDRRGLMDASMIDYAVFIRRHVPALVQETLIYLQIASRSERREAIDTLVTNLQQVGVGAKDRLDVIEGYIRDQLAVRQARMAAEFDKGRAEL